MKHYTYDDWLNYINGEHDQSTSAVYENHLYTCDQCLELYLQAVELTEHQMPEVSASFTDSVMQKASEVKKATSEMDDRKIKRPANFRTKTITHYFLAAAMTILLMSTGVFGQLIKIGDMMEHSEPSTSTSFFQSFLNQQESFTSKFELNHKEGDQ